MSMIALGASSIGKNSGLPSNSFCEKSEQQAWSMLFHGTHGSKHWPVPEGMHMVQPPPSGPPYMVLV